MAKRAKTVRQRLFNGRAVSVDPEIRTIIEECTDAHGFWDIKEAAGPKPSEEAIKFCRSWLDYRTTAHKPNGATFGQVYALTASDVLAKTIKTETGQEVSEGAVILALMGIEDVRVRREFSDIGVPMGTFHTNLRLVNVHDADWFNKAVSIFETLIDLKMSESLSDLQTTMVEAGI